MNNGPRPSTPPKDQFVTDVLPPYGDFVADPTLEHRAKAAANALACWDIRMCAFTTAHG
jgi:hypothetical protein